MLDISNLLAAIRPETCLVSVMGVNNEIGVVQPLKDIGSICRERRIYFHSDLAQMAGKIPVDVDEMQIDLASISSHKVLYIFCLINYFSKCMNGLYIDVWPERNGCPLCSTPTTRQD